MNIEEQFARLSPAEQIRLLDRLLVQFRSGLERHGEQNPNPSGRSYVRENGAEADLLSELV